MLIDGKMHMQLRLGQFTATAPLPEEMSTWSADQLQPFFDRIVPEMTQNLIAMRNDDNRKLRRKACANSSTKQSEDSEAKILQLPHQT